MPLLSRLAVASARGFGALSFKPGLFADFLVVAGGAGGGNSGGGGAGGFRTSAGTSGGGASAESHRQIAGILRDYDPVGRCTGDLWLRHR